jgi:hypothetical protein
MTSRYYHHQEVANIWGYVVNIHDACNYDIHFEFEPDLQKRYWNTIINKYTYADLSFDDLESIKRPETKIGTTYRCRLKGVGVSSWAKNKKPTIDFTMKEAHIAMIRQFDRQNGWVLCTISDVDIYRRLLVTLYDPITKRDLSEILLSEKYEGYFYPYALTPGGEEEDREEGK